jgi:polyisoprenyl-phosphate glycosyltransferase
MTPMKRVWVVTPVLRDVESFLRLRTRIQQVMSSLDLGPPRFVVVDDSGGFDREITTLRDLEDVALVETPFNLGHQRAIVYGLRKSLGLFSDDDIVITLDSDGEDRPEDIPRLLEPLREDLSDLHRIAVARRTGRKTTLLFKLFYVAFRALFRILTSTSVRSGNFAVYRGWLARRMLIHPNFDYSYSSALISMHVPITFIPCERGSRYAGSSRMNYPNLLLHGLRMLMPFADRIAIRALILFSVTFGLGVGLSVFVLAIKLFTDQAIPGWATSTLLGILILSFLAAANFVTLFTSFSQSRSVSLSNLEQVDNGRIAVTPHGPDRAV